MELLNTIKALTKEFISSPAPQSAQGALALQQQKHDQPSFVIPPSPTLQRLADSALQEQARRCLEQLGVFPTAQQWEMILAPTSSTCVIAGAGSGKSSSLILRLLLLHKLLNIPLDDMHVFSFTRASIKDFRQKLADKIIQWEEVIERLPMTDQRRRGIQALTKRSVTTFHSVLARLRRDALPGSNPEFDFFELPDSSSDDDDEVSSYNPFVRSNLTDKQAETLKAAHARAYQASEHYRELMTRLVQEQDRQYWLRIAQAPNQDDQLKSWVWDRLLQQEQTYHGYNSQRQYAPRSGYSDHRHFPYIDPYRAAVADWLAERGIPFTPLLPFPIDCPIPGGSAGQLRASFKIGNQLFLHIERYPRSPLPQQETERRLAFHERHRRRFIALYSGNTDQHKVLRPEDFDRSGPVPRLKPNTDLQLQQWINLSGGYALPTTSAPSLLIRLPGDLHDIHIAELLYQEGLFIESLGLEVEQLQVGQQRLDPISRAIAEALPLFWNAFHDELEDRGYLRFHDILTRLRDEQTLHHLRDKFKHHLFIDEFQDISPELVDWLAKTIRVHAESGTEASVIAIGDDAQSIYGWRGSHPTFLMRFDRYFPANPIGHITLVDNFRSRQLIIDAAEAVLAPVKHKLTKHGKSALQEKEVGCLDPVRLIEAPLTWSSASPESDLWHAFCTYVCKLLHDLESTGTLAQLMGHQQALSVFILARTNATRASIPNQQQLQSHLLQALHQHGIRQFQKVRIRTGTFHQSKGLEADMVLLLEDSKPPDEHPLRELVFSQARFLGHEAGTYTQTMADEARRLAYVALTRARLAIMWVPLTDRKAEDETQPEANGTSQTNVTVSPQGCFLLVKNHLQITGRRQ